MENFKEYMKEVYSQLDCNTPDNIDEIVFNYSTEFINHNIKWFMNCFLSGISPYKALTLI